MVDIIIRNGLIVDGSGNPGFQADIAVQNGLIIAIGDLSKQIGKTELDASGLVVAPGFIDAHAHSDTSFLLDDSGAAKLYQGITTEVVGQCGDSPFPALASRMDAMKRETADGENWYHTSFEDYYKHFRDSGKKMATNLALLVGHGCLRAGVFGYDDRPATPDELEAMKELLRRDLNAGAWGMSLGLEYSPGLFSTPEELAALGSVVKEYDGLIACHMRNEGLFIDKAIEELLNVGRESGAHVHISHLKIDNYKAHGRAPEVWALIQKAKAEGVNITCETGPHYALLDDSRLMEDGRFKMNPPLRSPADREAILEGLTDGTIDMIATDHAPHSAEEKARGLEKSSFCWRSGNRDLLPHRIYLSRKARDHHYGGGCRASFG